ncbi:MAG: LamG-like jellyroll fold domain-containing protein [Myxococcota bacterium]
MKIIALSLLAVGGCEPASKPTRDAPGTHTTPSSSTPAPSTAPHTQTTPTTPTSTALPAGSWSFAFEGGTVGDPLPATVPDDAGAIVAAADPGLAWVDGVLPGNVAVAFPGSGTGLVLDGPDLADLADLAAEQDVRIEATFRTAAHGRDGDAGRGVLVARGEGGPGYELAVVDGGLRFTVATASATAEVSLPDLVADGRWHRVTAARDAAAGELWLALDGRRLATAPDPTAGEAVTDAGPLHIGALVGDEGPLRGAIDLVRLVRAAGARPAEAPEREVVTVFQGRQEPVPGGGTYDTLRIPSIVRTPTGALLAFAEGRVDNICDFGDIDVVMKRSLDGGRTWEPVQQVVDGGTDKIGNPIPIVDEATGRVVLVTTHTPVDFATCTTTSNTCTCATLPGTTFEVRTSDDDGLTWSAPVDVTDALYDDVAWRSAPLLGPSHGIQLAAGPEAGALVFSGMHRAPDGKRGGHLTISRDGGATWSIQVQETDSPVNVNETTAAEMGDGSVLVNARHQLDVPLTPEENALGLRGEGWLTPDLQWRDDPPFARTPRFRGPVVHGTLLRHVGVADRLGAEPRVVFTYPAGEHGTNFGRRHDLRAWVSVDDAGSWAEGKRIVPGWAAYSDQVSLGDGAEGVLVEVTDDSGEYYRRIDFVRLATAPLDDPTLVAWSFEDARPGDDLATTTGSGPYAVPLARTGTVTAVDGQDRSTAAHFDGASKLCSTEADARGIFDADPRDGFVVEADFRTEAHGAGDAADTGTLASKTVVGSEPAWWLRVEDGHVRFLVSACDADTVNCGVFPGNCDGLTGCEQVAVLSDAEVSDGAWHTVRAGRDAERGELFLVLDGVEQRAAFDVLEVVKNDEPVCLGAFADGARAFEGDLDRVSFSLR